MSIEVRETASEQDFEDWRAVRQAVEPNERTLEIEALRRSAANGQTFLLAYADGELAGSGVTGRSDLPDAAFVAPRVLTGFRRRGVGTALLARLAPHAEALGVAVVSAGVEDPGSLFFAHRFGFAEVDRQIEQVRTVGDETAPVVPAGVTIVSVAQRPELWRRAYDDVARQGFEDMATIATIRVEPSQWESDWIGDPAAMFLALADDRVIGCAGLLPDPDRPGIAENALTAVARDWRGRGVALALKRTALRWAVEHGIREVTTWTQAGNTAMRELNVRLGYVPRAQSISVRARLPLIF
ncbi:GNAT family N-acetyltransferase [Actinoplanes couchii]|uniref:Phosphinothricin acetyltransferase n=1 Tax=Actinoplanes couchii TaxID=403638 RepID=A0ABQ3X8I1_9ACTN|nr:GNAT family N-acetyltransferase [Actinoplanes couchii]MDR6320166.1 GNAT superfamily N-acetyltransferase [Actinoplanes couchii]GID54820.1 phosphinothricin acetyltransferase [Actinoplanes couchii]